MNSSVPQQQQYPMPDDLEERLCPGCKLSVVSEEGGLVVAFGQCFFHVNCFKCAKCNDKVTADTNLLLLSDGSPICANCSYACNVCKQPILDEAIMTGDDAYHAHCFKCKVCKNRIDELVFAKTSQGIYCMDCHNERMIKIRKHTQKKAERDREKQAAQAAAYNELGVGGAIKGGSISTIFHPPPRTSSVDSAGQRSAPSKNHSLPVALEEPSTSNYPAIPSLSIPPPTNGGLHVTSTRDKRRSINPGLVIKPPGEPSPTSSTLSPIQREPPSPVNGISRSSPTSVQATSPLRENFPSSRPSSSASTNLTNGHPQRTRTTSAMSSSSGGGSTSLNGDESTVTMRPSPSPLRPTSPYVASSSRPNSANSLQKPERYSGRLSPRPGSAAGRDRPPSRADVPRSVESATDDDDDDEKPETKASRFNRTPQRSLTDDSTKYSLIDAYGGADSSNRATATFIAPALPPIRFSLNAADFSDLFTSVGGNMNSLKNLDTLASVPESLDLEKGPWDITPSTPPPSAASVQPNTMSQTLNVHAIPTISDLPSSGPASSLVLVPVRNQSSSSALSPTTIMVSPPTDVKGETKDLTSPADLVLQRLQDVLADATDRGAQQMKLDRGFVEAIVSAMATRKAEYMDARKQIDSMKRASKQYIDGITVAQTEYDRELKARRDAEAEVTRLRVLLSGQAARLTALTGDSRRQELRQQMSKELHENLNGLERDLSKLKAERDVALAEVEELNAVSSSSGAASESPANLNRTLTKRLDNLKSQYQRELVPLNQQREALSREIMELKAARDVFLEETTVLNARNEELAQLSAQYSRRVAMAPPLVPSTSNGPETPSKISGPTIIETPVRTDSRNAQLLQQQIPHQPHQMMVSSTEELEARKMIRAEETHTPSRGPAKVFKWGSRAKEVSAPIPQSGAEKVKAGHMEHSFQPLSLLRFTRCDHCGEKMWGSQLRCMGCSISVHTRCVNQVLSVCSPQMHNGGNNEDPLPPSMFGRDLIEQVRADGKGGPRKVPVIVEKCIEAVEKLAMDYEGIYRKTGGSGQSRTITQLFERGDYQAFDLLDSDRFNDICSVTSVLKTYLRTLPVPLLTHDLHDQFMSAVEIRDPALRNSTLTELVNNLPSEHYHTVRMLMLHLNRICQLSEVNLMNARNLGVVFGPTLMRSRNPGAEFSDMAGKALSIEWLVESAPQVFKAQTDI
ncbi:signal transducer [Lentinula aciculospora]|uniref:Signal transducer n=1 Tax=Lentinula aciculospora TaxID=153920 RepID=A0A9W8ZWB3_9AGAR|nr:signal transducer [Lentinula aciculospora]